MVKRVLRIILLKNRYYRRVNLYAYYNNSLRLFDNKIIRLISLNYDFC